MRDYYLNQIGVQTWQQRLQAVKLEENAEDTISLKIDNWDILEKNVSNCTACQLCQTRTQTVFGTGNRQADLMLIGEAPGAEEDRQGKPFVGRAGQLLTEMLYAIDLKRENIFISNILKCRPPNNRDPQIHEVQQCTPYLLQQINFIKPKLLVALGRIAAHYLLNTNTPLSRLRGQLFNYGPENTPLLITYHPAYLLRNPIDKAKSYQDLLSIRKQLNEIAQN